VRRLLGRCGRSAGDSPSPTARTHPVSVDVSVSTVSMGVRECVHVCECRCG
jgi:hypothetical protein